MQIIKSLEDYTSTPTPVVLTIGNFDGLHLGHQKVLQKVVQDAKKINGLAVVLTFHNHPLEVLHPEKPIRFLCTPQHKEKLIENLGIDTLFSLLFTREFSEQNPETFLVNLKKHIDYKKIILGYDARIGKGRSGDKETIIALSRKLEFNVEHLDPLQFDETPVSSSLIRKSISEGKFEDASKLLGRDYSILSTVVSGSQKGGHIGFPTANLDVSKLCLPPYGVYTVEVECEGVRSQGIANLGVAPTLKNSSKPVLEVYIFEETVDLYGKEMEVTFGKFLRPEMKFSSVEELRSQITKDIQQATNMNSEI